MNEDKKLPEPSDPRLTVSEIVESWIPDQDMKKHASERHHAIRDFLQTLLKMVGPELKRVERYLIRTIILTPYTLHLTP